MDIVAYYDFGVRWDLAKCRDMVVVAAARKARNPIDQGKHRMALTGVKAL